MSFIVYRFKKCLLVYTNYVQLSLICHYCLGIRKGIGPVKHPTVESPKMSLENMGTSPHLYMVAHIKIHQR